MTERLHAVIQAVEKLSPLEQDTLAHQMETLLERLLPASQPNAHGQARIVAARLNLIVTGSVGILLEAKHHQGIITLVRPYLDTMLAQGRRISPALYTHIIQEASESTGG